MVGTEHFPDPEQTHARRHQSGEPEAHQTNMLRLDDHECCVAPEAGENVVLLRVRFPASSPQTFSQQTVTSMDELHGALSNRPDNGTPEIRVFSISQFNSWKPLRISEAMLSEVLSYSNADSSFNEVIKSFRNRPCATEIAFCGHLFWTARGGCELSYTFKYPERRGMRSSEQWSIRQTAVYQRFEASSNRSNLILLHPVPEAIAQTRLEQKMSDQCGAPELLEQPVNQHILLISAYFNSWREYMVHFEEELLTISRKILGSSFDLQLRLNADTLTRLRFIESCFLPLEYIFQSYDETFEGLISFNNALSASNRISSDSQRDTETLLRNLIRQNGAYARNTRYLLKKIASLIKMLSDVLALKDQRVAQEQSKNLCALAKTSYEQSRSIEGMTRMTVKDSITIRVITLVMLVYLPTTFVGTLFGMQFFYLTPSHTLGISPHFWIFVAVSVPLTALTLLYWMMRKQRAVRRRLSIKDVEQTGEMEKEIGFE